MRDQRLVLEECGRRFDGHIEHLRDVLAAVGDFQRLFVIAGALAGLAHHLDFRQELQRRRDIAPPATFLAAPALDVEAEARSGIAACRALRRAGKQLSHGIVNAHVGGWVRVRRAADGALVNVDHVVQVLDSVDSEVYAGQHPAVVKHGVQPLVQNFVHQRALARSRHAGDTHQETQRDIHVDTLEIVLLRAADDQHLVATGAVCRRHGDAAPAAKVCAGQRIGVCDDLCG